MVSLKSFAQVKVHVLQASERTSTSRSARRLTTSPQQLLLAFTYSYFLCSTVYFHVSQYSFAVSVTHLSP